FTISALPLFSQHSFSSGVSISEGFPLFPLHPDLQIEELLINFAEIEVGLTTPKYNPNND
ncbi:MAG: hypothetical protein K2K64_04665, partial [Muribaculaceae bacterium]|nr:hypothetical protein [Muribaculaceae bacterium]